MTKINGKIIVSDPKVFEKFSNVIYRPIENEDIYTPLELFVKNIKAKLSKEKKGGKKSKYNVKMARKFRRTRRKRGRGEGMSRPEHIKTPKEICQEKKEQIEGRKNYQSDFAAKIKNFLPQFKELKKQLHESQARVTGFKSKMRGGGQWSENETREFNRLTQEVERVKADIERLKSTMNKDIKYVYYYKEEEMNKLLDGDEDYFINKYKEKIKEYENYFKDKNCENLLKEGGRKSRRNRRKSKKRKSRRRKKRTRRRKKRTRRRRRKKR